MDSKSAPPPSYNETAGYPPQQGYPAPQQPYNGPPQGYAPPQHGYPAGQPGYQRQPATVVVQQPYPGATVVYQNNPPDYFVASILACLCCFWPTGLCAIYYASRSRTLLSEGDLSESNRMANNARNLIIASVVLGICWIVLVIVLRAVVYTSTTRSYSY